jgi:ribosomal protein S9
MSQKKKTTPSKVDTEAAHTMVRMASATIPMKEDEAVLFLVDLFASVPKAVVRHSGKNVDLNTGELSVVGTTKLINFIGDITKYDVFLDVGSGIGNVIAQMAVQTAVARSIGIEIRDDVANVGAKLIADKAQKFSLLRKVDVIVADVKSVDLKRFQGNKPTVFFSNNRLFKPLNNLAMENMILEMTQLRLIVLGTSFCIRHRASCRREFCLLWELDQTIELPVTWADQPKEFFSFKRRSFN